MLHLKDNVDEKIEYYETGEIDIYHESHILLGLQRGIEDSEHKLQRLNTKDYILNILKSKKCKDIIVDIKILREDLSYYEGSPNNRHFSTRIKKIMNNIQEMLDDISYFIVPKLPKKHVEKT